MRKVAEEQEEIKAVGPRDGKDGDEKGEDELERKGRDEGMVATTCIARIAKPLFKMIDRPWKVHSSHISVMYPD